MSRYRAQTGGVMGSGLYPQANTGVDVGGAIDSIASLLAGRREGLIRKAMMQREFDRQETQDQYALEDRKIAADERTRANARQDKLDAQAEESHGATMAKTAEEIRAKRAEDGVTPDHYEPVMEPVSTSFAVPTIRGAMQASAGQFGGGAPKTGLTPPSTPSVGALPKYQLVGGTTDYTQGTKYKAAETKREESMADRKELLRFGASLHPKAPPKDPKPAVPTEGERRGAGLVTVANDAAGVLDAAGAPGYWNTLASRAGGQQLVSDQQQVVNQAALQLSASYLYLVSGATASPQEVEKTAQTFVPQVGDSKAVLERKAQARKVMLKAMRTMAGRAVPAATATEAPPVDLISHYGLEEAP